MKVYLAGPITGKTMAEANAWREDFALNLPSGYVALNPLRREVMLQQLVTADERASPLSNLIFSADLMDLQQSDLVVANMRGASRISVGTLFEMGYAYAKQTPILLIMEAEGNIHEHVFVRRAATFQVETEVQALSLLRRLG